MLFVIRLIFIYIMITLGRKISDNLNKESTYYFSVLWGIIVTSLSLLI